MLVPVGRNAPDATTYNNEDADEIQERRQRRNEANVRVRHGAIKNARSTLVAGRALLSLVRHQYEDGRQPRSVFLGKKN